MVRKTVEFAALVGNREVILFPGLVEQRDHPVVEEVEEIAQRLCRARESARSPVRV